jgi:alpha-mannosidase
MSTSDNHNLSFIDRIDAGWQAIDRTAATEIDLLDRIKAEIEFATRLADVYPAHADDWQALIEWAVASIQNALTEGKSKADAVAGAEAILAPIGSFAKNYTVHCIGHAHIDMNWMWNWPETVAVVNDTFTTVDHLMDEFPTFKFSQSQASIYQLMKDYLPWMYETVKQRVKEGRWEITANQWVEGDKNMSSGESICRHLLYTKRFFAEEFGLPYDAITLDWEPDTFGHPHTIPTILADAGVKRYYFCRTGPGPHVFWWQGKDGSRVLAFDDLRKWYNNTLDPKSTTQHLLDFEKETGLKDYMLVFGVGDHGGGPTRQDLRRGVEMNSWPIFPNIKFSTATDFFDIVESQGDKLPVYDNELNFIFEGCYTSQSNVKHANRRSEHAVVEAEIYALLGTGIAKLPYPADPLRTAWRHTLFNQFHDILPGSGAHATYEHAQGLFQEILANTTSVKTHSLRTIAGMVNTAACSPGTAMRPLDSGMRTGQGLGAGMGDIGADGAVSRFGIGAGNCDPYVIFNPTPWPRTEVITARVWNRDYRDQEMIVQDETGTRVPAQLLTRGTYWWMEHKYAEVAFPVEIPAMGYRAYSISRSAGSDAKAQPVIARLGGISKQGAETDCFSFAGNITGVLENEYLLAEIDQPSGAIIHLIDKRTGIDLVPVGEHVGLLEYVLQSPNGMSAWHIGQPIKRIPFTEGGELSCKQSGPHLGVLRSTHTLNDSTFKLDIMLAAGSPCIEFNLEVNWLERGGPDIGIPSLYVSFPLAIQSDTASFECPNGSQIRNRAGLEVPAQRWVDITGSQEGTEEIIGATLLNESKYGFSVDDKGIRMSLLRSSYDPDPLPEMGKHTIRYALQTHTGQWTASDSTRAGYAFNAPLNAINTTEQTGTLPTSQPFAELLTPNVMLSGMKKAEDSDAVIVRLYEMEGKATNAKISLNNCIATANVTAIQTDVLERPLAKNTASMKDGILSVDIPAFGMVTVKIG